MSIATENERLVLARNTIRTKMVSWGIAETTDNLTILAQKLDAYNPVMNSGYPTRIYVDSPPTKTEYDEGESLDLSGMVVKADWSDGRETDITSDCTYSISTGTVLTPTDTSINITWVWTALNVTYNTNQAIIVNESATMFRLVVGSLPTKTVYEEGEKLALSGVQINLEEYSESRGVINTTNVTSSCTFEPANNATLTGSNTTVTASYNM